MSGESLAFCFGIHNHQPIGNFDSVLVETTERSYRPFLERLRARPEVRLTVHCTGSLLAWLRERAPETFDLLGRVVADGRVELLTGGFYEPILAVLPDADKRGQIERLSAFLREEFGVRPRGMWLAERVWEPHLPRALREAGVEYVLVDDSHFALAGLDPDTLGGYYLTEDQGVTLGVFPINQRLRHLIPFAEVDKTVEYLEERRGRVAAITVADDGEKFGGWPGTYDHVYEQGWLDSFFDRVLATPWLTLSTFADVTDAQPASGRVYLPTASYQEMGEWALPWLAGEALETAKRDLGPLEGGARIAALLRGGFWRNFLVKYPEMADAYWKMLRVSAAVHAGARRAPGERRLAEAREALWRGQANDAYWHGIFGGCYLPHLRRGVKSALLQAERLVDDVTGETVTGTLGDVNGDGREEVIVRTPALALTVAPALGGSITELAARHRALDLGDVLTRRPEAYHAAVRRQHAAHEAGVRSIHGAPGHKQAGLGDLLVYDDFRRASLLDGLFDAAGELDAVSPWGASRFALGGVPLRPTVARADGAVTITLTLPEGVDAPLRVTKQLDVRGAALRARYRLEAVPAPARWAVQWNLALTAGHAPDRYLTLPGRPTLGSTGAVDDASEVALMDEWAGVQVRLSWSAPARLAWGPVETVSVSEGGFERIYQGTALLLTWALDAVAPAGGAREVWTTLAVGDA